MPANPRPIGYTITQTWCRTCAPEGVREFHAALREGDDHGVPYHCDTCGEPLRPCEHQWEPEWHDAYPSGQIRFCTVPDCGEAERRDAPDAT
jgi:hypothetical protein